jgi:sortase (surface protein transpeptidase)
MVAFVVLGACISFFTGTLLQQYVPSNISEREEFIREPEIPVQSSPPDVPEEIRHLPTRLVIPKLSLSAPFEAPLGLNEDGTVEVPVSYDTVGWYRHGATPGESGTSVVLGHVDSKSGPAVFYSLGQLLPGDEINVTRDDGSIATFVVRALERYSQADFPTERVYGNVEGSELRLVTCSGVYDRSIKRYSHNLVVYAVLESVREVVTDGAVDEVF